MPILGQIIRTFKMGCWTSLVRNKMASKCDSERIRGIFWTNRKADGKIKYQKAGNSSNSHRMPSIRRLKRLNDKLHYLNAEHALKRKYERNTAI